MDYYEELGLKPTSTAPEIRRAYKVLARLVHPDGQPNPQIRDMAERQMKRLNEILATLTDEERRREYDAQLAARIRLAAISVRPAVRIRPPEPADLEAVRAPAWVQPIAGNWFWISMAFLVLCVGSWYVAQARLDSAPAAQAVPLANTQPMSRPTGNVRTPLALPGKGQATTTQPPVPTAFDSDPLYVHPPIEASLSGQAEQPQNQLRAPPSANPSVTAPDAANAVPAPAGADPAAPLPEAGTSKMRSSPFAGNWLFVPDPAAKPQLGVYSATYVELLLKEDRGRLSGTYRAQYQVPDRAVSPEVSFQVKGDPPLDLSASLQWVSADGAKGVMEMALTGSNAMKVTWWTTEFGHGSSLASGSAKLVRLAP